MASVELPAASVVQAATGAIRSAKSALAGMFWVDGILLISPFAVLGSNKTDKEGIMFGLAFWILVAGLFTLRFWRRLATTRRAETAAKTNPVITWRLLDNRQIVAIDGNGIPQIELSFKISRGMRDILLAVPEARVVQR